MNTAAILQLISILEPQIVNVVMMVKDKKTGTMTVFAVLDSVDAQTAANQTAIQNFLGSHPTG